MNIPPEVLNAHQLFLRDDFEEELGVLDQFRRPNTEEEWAERVLRAKEKGEKIIFSYADHLEARATELFPLLFAIFAPIRANCAAPEALVADCDVCYPVPFAGLFYDATLRINAALGLPIDGPCPIVASRTAAQPLNYRVNPSHFLLHNRYKHTFHVLPWAYFRAARDPSASAA